MNITGLSGCVYKQGKIIKDYTGWDFKMWPLAELINGVFLKKMYGRLAGTKNKVFVLTM